MENLDVADELAQLKSFPLHYMIQPEKAKSAVRLLCGADFREEHPYLQNGITDTARQNAYALLVDCLPEMLCDRTTRSYNGSLVTADKVIMAINNACEEWGEGGPEAFVEAALDSFLQAGAASPIRNVRRYMKAVIWTSLNDFRVKIDLEIARLLQTQSKQEKEF